MREAKSTEHEEEEEGTFVPSAVSVPLKPLFRCDNQCSEKTLSFWQFALVVKEEGEDHTRPIYASNVTADGHQNSRGRKIPSQRDRIGELREKRKELRERSIRGKKLED